jgi:hypothetical protein
MRRLDTCYRNIRLFSVDFDYPNVNSNSTVIQDFTTTAGFPLGTHILTWGFGSDATGIEDLLLQFKFVDVDTLRMTLTNNTGGAINAGVITTQFVTGEFNEDLEETI